MQALCGLQGIFDLFNCKTPGYASAFAVGGHVLIWGRIQSRDYVKKLSETETEKRTAYEVSVSKLEYID